MPEEDTRPAQLATPSARMIRKIATAVGVGAIAYFITNIWITNGNEQQLWVIILSVLISVTIFLIQLLHAVEGRLSALEKADANHAGVVARVMQAEFAKINAATELFGQVEASPMNTDAVIELVRHSTRIDPASPPLILHFAQTEIDRTSDFLQELGAGVNLTYEGEDRDWILSLAGNAESTIDATSLMIVDAHGDGRWSSDLGQRYLDVQRAAVQRGVRIRRVFIVDGAGLASTPDFLAVCKLQESLGIEVRVLDTAAIPVNRRGSLFDFIIFDEVVSYETSQASSIDGSVPPIMSTRLELRSSRVRDRKERFRDLYESALPPDRFAR